jgi:hypothetical protein
MLPPAKERRMMDEVWYKAPDWATTNPLALLVWGVAGGLVVALLLIRLHRWSTARLPVEIHDSDRVSTDVINFGHLQVVGVGGLGLVVMCAIVAMYTPAIGLPLGVGGVLGTISAIVLVHRRRKAGPLSSSSQSPGANTTLMIDAPAATRAKAAGK